MVCRSSLGVFLLILAAMSMIPPPTGDNRLYVLPDPAPGPKFERLAAYAARVFEVPMALISFVDADQRWVQFHHVTTLGKVPRNQTLRAHALMQNQPLVVPDATLDARFADEPWVTGKPFIRFYASAPLKAHHGTNHGSLCLLDDAPRAFSKTDKKSLVELAGVVTAAVEAHLTERRLRGEIAVHEQTFKALREVEANYRRIAENSLGLVYQLVRPGTVRSRNPSPLCSRCAGKDGTGWRTVGSSGCKFPPSPNAPLTATRCGME